MEKNQNFVPEYAKVFGKGKFAGVGFVCSKCGKRFFGAFMGAKPPNYAGGICLNSRSGLHNWVKA